MEKNELIKLGLTKAEAKIYYSVLKLKICTVRDISKDCGFHRTNIYDILEQLKEKGLIATIKEGKIIKYGVSNPNNFYEILKEKKEALDSIYPELESLYSNNPEGIQVEVYKGEEGMKSSWRDMIRENKSIYGYGVRGQLREKLPIFAEQWIRDAKNKKILYYGIYTERNNPPSYITEMRYVSKELSSPVATFIYGDKININIWEPTLIAIVIKSKLVASMFKNHFNLLWKIAKK
jgi:sugar-specific transcriptional regulator TrmB